MDMAHSRDEIKEFITEFEPESSDNIVDILRGRVQFAIMDQLNHMIRGAEIGNPDEIKKLVLRDVKNYIESFEYVSHDELEED